MQNKKHILKNMLPRMMILLYYLTNYSYAQNLERVDFFGISEYSQSFSSCSDISDNIYLTGSYMDSIKFGDITLFSVGFIDVFITKFSPNGSVIWAISAGGISSDNGHSITVDKSGKNIYITGTFYDSITLGDTTITGGPFYLAKIDSSGKTGWAKSINSEGGGSFLVKVDNENNILVTGSVKNAFIEELPIDGPFLLVKYNEFGHLIWIKEGIATNNGPVVIQPSGLEIDINDNILISGSIQNTTITFDSAAVFTPVKKTDIFVLKYDKFGNLKWLKQFGGSGAEHSYDISIDPSGNSYITGYYEQVLIFDSIQVESTNEEDIFIAKLNENGDVQWVNSVGSIKSDFGKVVVYNKKDHSVYIGCDTNDSLYILDNLVKKGTFLVKYKTTGEFVWLRTFSSPNNQSSSIIRDLVVDSVGDLYFTGRYTGSIIFDSLVHDSTYKWKIYLGKISEQLVNMDTKEIINLSNKLHQNYPNPFNSSTRINFFLSESGFITLTIFNILGERVKVLSEGYHNLGIHQVEWNANDKVSGLYIYQLQTNNFTSVKKLLLLK